MTVHLQRINWSLGGKTTSALLKRDGNCTAYPVCQRGEARGEATGSKAERSLPCARSLNLYGRLRKGPGEWTFKSLIFFNEDCTPDDVVVEPPMYPGGADGAQLHLDDSRTPQEC